MPNVQLQLDTDLLSRARAAAGRDGTTLNAVVRELLGHWLRDQQPSLAAALRMPERGAWRPGTGLRAAATSLLQRAS
jgi:hypothetical protein